MKKVVLLGDSIRLIGYGKKVPELLKDECEVWQPNDNCRFSAYTLRMLFDSGKELETADVIHWNNGLWDCCNLFGDGPFTPLDVYLGCMKRIGGILLRHTDKVIFATTTPVTSQNKHDKNSIIREYNAAVSEMLSEMGIVINDLYSLVEPNIDSYIRKDDNIHLSDAGIDACAGKVAESIRDLL